MVSVSVSEIFGIGKSIGIGFEKNWYWSFFWHYNNDIIQSTNFDLKSFRFGFENFPYFFMVSVSVSKIFGIGKSIGISFEKDLVPKKVSVSKKMVLEKVSDLFRFWVSSHTGIYTVLSQI